MGLIIRWLPSRNDWLRGHVLPTFVKIIPESDANPVTFLVVLTGIRDVHGNGIPNRNGNPMGIPWEWD